MKGKRNLMDKMVDSNSYLSDYLGCQSFICRKVHSMHNCTHTKKCKTDDVSFSHSSKLPLTFQIIWPTNHDCKHFVSTNIGKLIHILGMTCVRVGNSAINWIYSMNSDEFYHETCHCNMQDQFCLSWVHART